MISPFYLLVKSMAQLAQTRSLQDSPLKCTIEDTVGKHLINWKKIDSCLACKLSELHCTNVRHPKNVGT